MPANFVKTMARLPSEDLFRIAEPTQGEDYEAEAIAAAREELARRNLSAEDAEDMVPISFGAESRADRRDEALRLSGWIAFALFGPFLGLGAIAVIVFLVQGYFTKAIHGVIAMVAGIVLWVLAAIAVVALA